MAEREQLSFSPRTDLTADVWQDLEGDLTWYWKYDRFKTRKHRRNCYSCQSGCAQSSDQLSRLSGAITHSIMEDTEGRYKLDQYVRLAAKMELLQPGRLAERFRNQALQGLLVDNIDYHLRYREDPPSKKMRSSDLDILYFLKVLYPETFRASYLENDKVRSRIQSEFDRSLSIVGRYYDPVHWGTYVFCLYEMSLVFPSMITNKYLNEGIWRRILPEYFKAINSRLLDKNSILDISLFDLRQLMVVAAANNIHFPDEQELKALAVSNFRWPYQPYMELLQEWKDELAEYYRKGQMSPIEFIDDYIDLQFLQPGNLSINDERIALASAATS